MSITTLFAVKSSTQFLYQSLVLMGSLVLMFVTQGVIAQPQTNTSVTTKRQIEEVIVTATKRAESARDLPISIDAFSGDDLGDRSATGLEDILKYSPGVVIQKGAHTDSSSIAIRGIGGSSKYLNRTFGLFYEDVSLVNPTVIGPQPDIDPFDLQSVEVLKGPQGTLFGGSALAGAVRYIPKAPDFDQAYGQLAYEYGQFAESDDSNQDVTAMANLPLGEQIALRLVGSGRTRAGYVDDLFSGERDINTGESRQYRVQLRWQPTEQVSFDLSYLDRKAQSDDSSTVDNEGNPDNRYINSHKRAAEDSLANTEVISASVDWDYFSDIGITLASSQLKKTGYIHLDLLYGFQLEDVPGLRSQQEQNYDTDQVSHELRLVSKDRSSSKMWLFNNWKYVVGLYSMESDQFFTLDIPVPSLSVGSLLDQLLPFLPELPLPESSNVGVALYSEVSALAKEKALYFDATKYLFNDRLELNIGGRYYRQETTGVLPVYAQVRLSPLANDILLPLQTPTPDLVEEGFNPKLALTWHLQDNISVFASAVKGFRFGGFNADPLLTGEPEESFESDEIWNYELGLRSSWLDDRLQFDVTAFYIDWKNMQIEEFISLGLYAYVLNIGGSENLGAEMSMKALLPKGFFLVANAGYSDAVFSETFTTPSGGTSEKGSSLPVSPHLTASLVLSNETMRGGWRFGADVFVSYQGDSRNNFENDLPLDDFYTFGISLRSDNQNLPMRPELKLTVNNISNESAVLYGLYETNVTGTSSNKELLQPRLLTLGLKLNFE